MNGERVCMFERRKDDTILTQIFDMSFPLNINFDIVEKVDLLLRVSGITYLSVTELWGEARR